MPASFDGLSDRPLLLGHLHRHGLELAQPARAAELAAARADAAEQLGLVARADLLHLDARVQRLRQVAHQLAEVDAALGAEVEDHLARRRRASRRATSFMLMARARMRARQRRCASRSRGAVELVAREVARVGACAGSWRLGARGRGDARRGRRSPRASRALHLDDDLIAAGERQPAAVVVVDGAGGLELDADDRRAAATTNRKRVVMSLEPHAAFGSGSDCGWRSAEARGS